MLKISTTLVSECKCASLASNGQNANASVPKKDIFTFSEGNGESDWLLLLYRKHNRLQMETAVLLSIKFYHK